ncbi:MAG: putative sugar nucleotidyl transferase [Gemmatimonadota bacterium]|nr:putative sugar nucleotidyl transferase [Gemmatimonadota bacterium]
MSPRLLLYDDAVAREWQPFAATRPIGELLFGTATLRERAEACLGLVCEAHVASTSLRHFEEPDTPPCTITTAEEPCGERVYLSSRFVPDDQIALDFEEPTVLLGQAGPVGAWLPDGEPFPVAALAGLWPSWPRSRVRGTVLGSVWELIASNPGRVIADAHRFPERGVPSGVHRLGIGRVAVSTDSEVEPGVVLDTTGGPVIVDAGARVQAPCRVVGPAYLGTGSVLLGGIVAHTSIGPACRVHGEVRTTVMLGFSNKAHEGYVGHSLVGRWVNLGAMTTNSDLKNTYRTVRADVGSQTIDTGLTKAGCLVGDHVRTGIGTLINTGTLIGAGTSMSGGDLVSGWIPPFSWGAAGAWAEHDIERFIDTAARVMGRRQVALTSRMRRHYRTVFAATAPSRSELER